MTNGRTGRDMFKTGRTKMIGSIIMDLQPVTATAIRNNLIERYGTSNYTNMTTGAIASHVRIHMRGNVERTKIKKDVVYRYKGSEPDE